MKIALVAVLPVAFVYAGQSIAVPSPRTDWGTVKQLTTGAEIRVVTADRKTVRAKFESATDESLTLVEPGGQESLSRSSITAVSLKGSGHRAKHMLIGLGAGAAGGLGVGAFADSQCNPHALIGCRAPNIGKAVITPIGAVLGVGIGALLPAGGWREIYRPH